MIAEWAVFALVSYLLVAAAMMFILWPHAPAVPRWIILRDSIGWPYWALLLIVEVTEEARRGRLGE